MNRFLLAAAAASTLLLAGCDGQTNASTVSSAPPPPLVRSLTLPSGNGAGEPNLALMNDGRVLLSWLEKRGVQPVMRMAVHEGKGWSPARDVVAGDRLLVNWADFPSIVQSPDGTLIAHWLEKVDTAHAYNVRFARSKDGGSSWSAPAMLHDDGTETEHGFVSFAPDPRSNAVAVTWLDGRRMTPGAHDGAGDMSLRFAMLRPDGTKGGEMELDNRTCECCQTGMAITSRGPVIVYRDRSSDERRDIGIARRQGDRWVTSLIHDDGWKIAGCPVNGPQIDARGQRAAVAWFTQPGEGKRVSVAFSDDGGATFGKPIAADDGNPLGRVDIAMLEDGSALVSWLESAGGGAEIRIRKMRANGVRGESQIVGRTTAARASGFPRMVVSKGTAWVVWTEPGEISQLRGVIVDVKGLNR